MSLALRNLAYHTPGIARRPAEEERRIGVDNQAYGRSFERMGELAYTNFAYAHSVIGSMADLSAATVDDVKAFVRTYYAPNNAVLSIVGDVNTKDTLAKVEKYFGRIPRQPDPDPVDMTEPPQKAEKRETIEDPLARLWKDVGVSGVTISGIGAFYIALDVISSRVVG